MKKTKGKSNSKSTRKEKDQKKGRQLSNPRQISKTQVIAKAKTSSSVALAGRLTVTAAALAGFAFGIYYEITQILGTSILLARINVTQGPISCALVASCRSVSSYGAHSIVWIILFAIGIYATVYQGSPFATKPEGMYDGLRGFLVFAFAGSLHEVFWNVFAFSYYRFFYILMSVKALGTLTFILLTGAMVLVFLVTPYHYHINFRRLIIAMIFWVGYMALWLSIGFPVSLYAGQTAYYFNPYVNFIEIASWLVFGMGITLSLKRSSHEEFQKYWEKLRKRKLK